MKTVNSKYAFGTFVFDAVRRELLRDGEKVELNPQPLRLLELLLVNAPATISRNRLQKELWPDKVTIEFEQSLNTCVGQLRSALGESAKDPAYIRTEPKIGYKFIAPVKAVSSARSDPLWKSVAAGVVILSLVTAAALFSGNGEPATSATSPATTSQVKDMILRARSLRKFGDLDAMRESLSYFENALRIDSEERESQGGAALNLAVLAGRPDFPVRQSYERSLSLAERSVQKDPPSVDGLLARGFIALYDRWDVDAALRDFRYAVKIAPEYALAQAWLASALAAQGELEQAVKASERAVELEPVTWYIHSDLCWYLIFQNDTGRASDVCAGAVEIEPGRIWSQLGLMEVYRGTGRYDGAAAILATIARGLGTPLPELPNTDDKSRFTQSSCGLADQLGQRQGPRLPDYLIASFYAQCKDFTSTALWLRRSHKSRESFALFYLSDPRFSEFKRSDIGRLAHAEMEQNLLKRTWRKSKG